MSALKRRSVLAAATSLVAGLGQARAQEGITGVVAAGARAMPLYTDGMWCEGPVWDHGTGLLLFSDVRRNRLMRLGPGGTAVVVRDPSGFANGNGVDSEGRIVSCEHLGRRLTRQEADGRLTVLADRYRGKRLNSPNDLVFARDGAVWFTDPTFGLTQPDEGRMAAPEQPGRYVFRWDPDGTLDVVADSFEQPNGIAFSPDQRTLYVSDTSAAGGREGKREVRAFDVLDERRLARERVFSTVDTGVPDGLAVDAAGRVFAATDAGATIWRADGALLGRIPTPAPCGNLAFGGPGGSRLFLCNGSHIHAVDTLTKGSDF